MPEISRFLGIVIVLYYRDHGPPHFHALYGGSEAIVEIATGRMAGDFPPRASAHVQEWLSLHREDLWMAWELARDSKPLPKIAPLE
jgi:hypothetical protein